MTRYFTDITTIHSHTKKKNTTTTQNRRRMIAANLMFLCVRPMLPFIDSTGIDTLIHDMAVIHQKQANRTTDVYFNEDPMQTYTRTTENGRPNEWHKGEKKLRHYDK